MGFPRIVFVSFPHFLRELSSLLDRYVEPVCVDVPTWRRWPLARRVAAVRNAQAVHFFWGRVKLKELFLLKLVCPHVINHFIGTDVLKLLQAPRRKQLEARLVARLTKTVAVSENLAEELRSLRVQARVIPFVSSRAYPRTKEISWPEGPPWRFLTYVPPQRREFYGFSRILQLARSHPDIEFSVLALSAADIEHVRVPPNFRPLGWREDVPRLLAQSHGLLRITEHDGLPNLVVEALGWGRYVVYTGALPGCIHVRGDGDLDDAVEDVTRQTGLNEVGMEFVRNALARERIRSAFLDLYAVRDGGVVLN